MEKMLEVANEILALIESRQLNGWQQDAVLDTAKLIAHVRLRSKIDTEAAATRSLSAACYAKLEEYRRKNGR